MKILLGLMIVLAWGICWTGGERLASSSQRTEQSDKAVSNANMTPKEQLSGEDHYYKANNLKQALEPEEALKEYHLAIENGYDTVELRIEFGLLLADHLDRQEEAAEQFRIAAQRDPMNWRAHWPLAQSLLAAKKYDEALRELQVAERLDPEGYSDGFYFYFEAKALDGLERYQEALKAYEVSLERANKIRPGAEDVLEARARIKAIQEKLKRN